MSDNEKFNVSADWSANAQINQDKYNEWYETSFNNNEDFWNEHGKRIEWIKPYTKVKDVSFNKDNFSISLIDQISYLIPPRLQIIVQDFLSMGITDNRDCFTNAR